MSFRWGILGPGNIAKQFARGLAALPDHELAAVGSRDQGRARAFADEFGADRAHGSYADLIADDGVDAIYIATPHTGHQAATLACLATGRPVLCEKPLAVNGEQVAAMIAAAREHDTFLMEAMWTRFLPVYNPVRRWLDEGAIGQPRLVQASFGFRCGWNPAHRLLDPDLAGGALLDVGIYVLGFALWVFGKAPVAVKALGHVGETGVDEQTGILLQFDAGELAVLSTAVRTRTEHAATIFGTDGHIAIEPPFWKATTARLDAGERQEEKRCDHWSNGYEYEAAEVARCVGAGRIESPTMSHQMSSELMALMDDIRRQLGVVYPADRVTA